MDEEEREALPDFLKSTTGDQRCDLAMRWLGLYHEHPAGSGVDDTNKDPKAYTKDNA